MRLLSRSKSSLHSSWYFEALGRSTYINQQSQSWDMLAFASTSWHHQFLCISTSVAINEVNYVRFSLHSQRTKMCSPKPYSKSDTIKKKFCLVHINSTILIYSYFKIYLYIFLLFYI